MQPRDRIRHALARDLMKRERPALVGYITAGFPEPSEFLKVLKAVASAADAVEIGVPFSDPMADGVTIQRSSERAIAQGVTLRWILDRLGERKSPLATPVLLMSYLNPLLAFGYETLARRARAAGVAGFLVPDLPFEESAPLRAALQQAGVFPRDVESTERYLRRIGRQRAEQILALLLQADSGLKGGSRLPERLQLEQLLLRLCGSVSI